MKKILSILLISCFLFTGCGNGNTEDYVLDEVELLENGYTNIANVAYVKVENETENESITIYIVCMDDLPINSYHLVMKIAQKLFIYNCNEYDIVLTWNGQEYIFSYDILMNQESYIDYFPSDWREIIDSRVSGTSITDMISVPVAQEINEGVEEFFTDF